MNTKGYLMDIPMDDIKEIQDSIADIKTQQALAERTLDSMLKTQDDIVQILTAIAVQGEKNKVYDATVKKCDSMNLKIASVTAFVSIIVAAAAKYIFT